MDPMFLHFGNVGEKTNKTPRPGDPGVKKKHGEVVFFLEGDKKNVLFQYGKTI